MTIRDIGSGNTVMDEHEQTLRNLFADELGEAAASLASQVRDGTDNSIGGTAAVRAMLKAVAAERERCASKLVAYIAEHGGTIELRAVVDAIREGE
jgi:hypothetical protein